MTVLAAVIMISLASSTREGREAAKAIFAKYEPPLGAIAAAYWIAVFFMP